MSPNNVTISVSAKTAKMGNARLNQIPNFVEIYGNLGGPMSGTFTGLAAPTSSVRLLLPVFVSQRLPEASTAGPLGLLSPPPVKPVEGESA
jgi:hypothetical protein